MFDVRQPVSARRGALQPVAAIVGWPWSGSGGRQEFGASYPDESSLASDFPCTRITLARPIIPVNDCIARLRRFWVPGAAVPFQSRPAVSFVRRKDELGSPCSREVARVLVN